MLIGCLQSLFFSTLLVAVLPAVQPPSMTPVSQEHLLSRGVVPHDDFLIIALPRSGSHYLMSIIHHLLGQPVDEGYDWIHPDQLSSERRAALISTLQRCKQQQVIHKMVTPFSPQLERVLVEAQHKWLFMTRDPRDALVSLLFHLEDPKWRGIDRRGFFVVNASVYDTLSLDNKLTALMTGSCCQNFITEFYQAMAGWANSPYGLTLRFEDLVGPEGKGDSATQMETLLAVADYLDCGVSIDELEGVALYSYSPWGRQEFQGKVHERGQIGSWKRFFKLHHKNIFKHLYGLDLIKDGYEKDFEW